MSVDEDQQPYLYHILGNNYPVVESFGFAYSDVRHFLRAALEVREPEDQVVLDYTGLVQEGYFSEQDDLRALAVDELSEDFVVNQKIIVLTEGSTDTPILSRSLAVLYPHVQDFYSFVDFTASNLAGGAGALVSTIKAFVGSGIQNRTVALFDNDTAARDALRALSGVNLPGNIKIVQLSALDFAKEYPTIGPQGQVDISRSSSSWRGNSVSPEERFNRLGRYRSTPSPTPRRSRR